MNLGPEEKQSQDADLGNRSPDASRYAATLLMHRSPMIAALAGSFYFLSFLFLTVHFFLSARGVKPTPNYVMCSV